jgi:hypothetical protein
MGNFIRNISSLIGGRPDAAVPVGEPQPSSPVGAADTPTAADQPALPLVPYAAAGDDHASPHLRRPRSVNLLRQASALAVTTRTAPTLPALATRHAPAHASRPFLTETERVRLQVMQAQIQLSSLRLYEGPIDGNMSPATAMAVRYFQTLKGLRPSGTLAAGTLAALGVPLVG